MRLAVLYLRSRLAGYAAACLVGVALLGWLAASWILTRPFMDPEMHLVPVLIFAPLTAACVIGIGTSSPFGDSERTSSRSLPSLRLSHLAGLLAWSALTLSLAALTWNLDYAGWVLVRNLMGFTGLAFLGAWLIGSHLSWLAPLAFDALTVFTGRVETLGGRNYGILEKVMGDVSVGEWERWAWPMRPYADPSSWAIALVLLAAGLGAICLFGSRESKGDTEQ